MDSVSTEETVAVRRVSELPRFTVGRERREAKVDSRLERRRTSEAPSEPGLLTWDEGLWAREPLCGETSFFSRAGLTLFLR